MTVNRTPGPSARLKLALSYAGFLMLAGILLLGAVWLFLLRYVPDRALIIPGSTGSTGIYSVFPVRSELLHVFAPRAAAVLAFLLVFGLVGGWILAGRMLAPLTRITEATRTAASGSLSHRVRLSGRSDEFRELADAFDTMLGRLEAHSAEQQRFAANASHELRTPLAIMQTLLDAARADPSRADDELLDRLHVVNARAIELTEALLLLSRADQRAFVPEPVDLSLIAEEATETLLPLAVKRGVSIETAAHATPATGSPALLLQMATNLVHNAIVHNLPEHGTVWVTTSVQPDRAVLAIENAGENLNPQLIRTLGEPFRRGTERVHADHAGAGLGLAIVKSIAQAHDGTLTLTPRAAGGLRVMVDLPARQAAPGSHDADLGARSTPQRPRRRMPPRAGNPQPRWQQHEIEATLRDPLLERRVAAVDQQPAVDRLTDV